MNGSGAASEPAAGQEYAAERGMDVAETRAVNQTADAATDADAEQTSSEVFAVAAAVVVVVVSMAAAAVGIGVVASYHSGVAFSAPSAAGLRSTHWLLYS